jgi:hypothetical protein
VAEILELPHLVYQNRMPDMQVGRRRIETGLYDEAAFLLQFLFESALRQYFVGASGKLVQLFVNCGHDLLRVSNFSAAEL